jgi:hypothetical protein
MSTFYVLPSRALLGQRVGEFLEGVFPGLHWQRSEWPDLAESLGLAAVTRPDVYVLYREDVPDGGRLADALAAEFGAERGDEVVEVLLGGRLAPLAVRRWRLGDELRPAA